MKTLKLKFLLLGAVFLPSLLVNANANISKLTVNVCFSNVQSYQGMLIQKNGNKKRIPAATSLVYSQTVPLGTNFSVYSLQMQPLLSFAASRNIGYSLVLVHGKLVLKPISYLECLSGG